MIDVAVIGAGIQGAGVAQALAAAGYSVVVLEKSAIAAGTSSRSSKLIHGGLRYLESYQFSLVRKSLRERRVLCRIAPALVKLQPFYIPIYKTTTRRPWQIRLGLSLYALLGGLRVENRFNRTSKQMAILQDKLCGDGLQKVYRYYDGQTDDVALTRAVMHSARQLGVTLHMPAEVMAMQQSDKGWQLHYQHNGQQAELSCRLIVNATGPWVNTLHQRIRGTSVDELAVDLVQGTHIVLDAPAPSGIYYLEAPDQRAVFVMPYHYQGSECTLVGTTETLFHGQADDSVPTADEQAYLQQVYRQYFPQQPCRQLHAFAGLRVLPQQQGSMFVRPRDTILHWAAPGVLSLYGGKLTAYRGTAEQVTRLLRPRLGKRRRIARTEQLLLVPAG